MKKLLISLAFMALVPVTSQAGIKNAAIALTAGIVSGGALAASGLVQKFNDYFHALPSATAPRIEDLVTVEPMSPERHENYLYHLEHLRNLNLLGMPLGTMIFVGALVYTYLEERDELKKQAQDELKKQKQQAQEDNAITIA